MVRFCPSCEKVMRENVATGRVRFICPACKQQVEPDEDDYVLYTKDFSSEFNPYGRLIRGAAKDPVGNKIDKKCPECPREWMTRIRLGPEELPVLTCECGYTEAIK